MNVLTTTARGAVLSLALLAAACMNDTGGDKPPVLNSKAEGTFRVELNPSASVASMSGKVYDGPSPSILAWTEDRKSGACKLLIPDAPFCNPGCSSSEACVSDNKCEKYPNAVSVGRVTVTGVKTKTGATSFTMDPLFNNYQPSGTTLEFPPFAEGATVTVSAAGDTVAGAFTATAKGIGPLQVKDGVLLMEDGKPLVLEWTAPGMSGTKVHVEVDISHHGGTKGVIECETDDNGRLEIAADLVTRLKALGVAGWPIAELTRQSKGTSPVVKVDLLLESKFVKDLSIPGLTSCSGDEDCTAPLKCQNDMTCRECTVDGDCATGKTCSEARTCI